MTRPMARVLLVNPWIFDFAAYDLWARPLGLLYLGAMLEAAGCEVRLVDCLDRLHPDSGAPPRRAAQAPGTGRWLRAPIPTPGPLAGIPRQFARYGLPVQVFQRDLASGFKPDLVLMGSSMTYWYPGVHLAIKIVRETWPGVPIFLGGNYATLCPDHARAESNADLVVEGPGEAVLSAILDAAGWTPTTGAGTPKWFDHRPALHLYPRLESAPLLTSRGCPFRCPYCASGRLFPAFEQRTPEDVLDEIEDHSRRYQLTDFAFFDDALLVDAQNRLLPILEALAHRRPGLRFHAPNGLHVGLIDLETAELMHRAGFRTIRLGVESLDPARQESLGDKTNIEAFRQAAKNLKTAGFGPDELGAYILFGLPGQDLEEVLRTAQAVKELGVRPYLAEYSPLPGTPLWPEALKLSPFDLVGEPLFQNNTFFSCRPEGFTWDKVWEIKRRALG